MPSNMLSSVRSQSTKLAKTPFRFLVLSPDLNGNLLELVIVDDAHGPRVIHAMSMREQYKSLLQGGAR
jgi:hypothetical protein